MWDLLCQAYQDGYSPRLGVLELRKVLIGNAEGGRKRAMTLE